MKSIFKLSFLSLVFFIASCDGLSEINVDPDRSPTARPQEVLTSAIGYIATVMDGDLNQTGFLWGQYWTWGPGVSLGDTERYVAEPIVFNGEWARSYSNALADLKFLTESGQSDYVGVAKILQAYTYQMLVDHFGDIPFSQALQGEIKDGSILTPAYDDDAAVYANLIIMLDDALANLEKAGDGNIGSEDLIYGGDLAHWITFANSLKLRILLRQSNVAEAGKLASDIRAIVQGGDLIASASDIAKVDFVGTSGDENPMFAFRESGIGNFYVASNSSLNVLNSLNDPRIGAIYDVAPDLGTYAGINQGAIDDEPFTAVRTGYSQGSAITYSNDAPVILMSNWEVWFLRAEAAARYGTADDDATAFGLAVDSHFDFLGVEGAESYVADLGYGGDLKAKITSIAIQKWISFNGLQEAEGWIEARRFDTPDNPIFTDLENGIWTTPPRSVLAPGVYPTIFLYPESEKSFNPNSPPQRLLTEKVFWDN